MAARVAVLTRAAVIVFTLAASARAEVHFALAHQYTRCTPCHYSPTGGGLLTPYGRVLSRQELSTFGRLPEGTEIKTSGMREEAFIFGLLPREGFPLDAGINVRPSQLRLRLPDDSTIRRNLWMEADGQVAFRKGHWTAYGEFGRLTSDAETKFISREHWVSYERDDGLAIRAGRFLPAYGLRIVDHSSFTRDELGFNQVDQIYGVEFSDTSDRQLVQVAVGTRAESLIEDDGNRAITASSRMQWELRKGQTLVMSGLYRGAGRYAPASGLGGLAWGWSPQPNFVLWSEINALVAPGWKGTPKYVLSTEASYQLYRGLWLRFQPQLMTELANINGGMSRYAFYLQFLPRTHWDLNLAYARERQRVEDQVYGIWFLQCHIYM